MRTAFFVLTKNQTNVKIITSLVTEEVQMGILDLEMVVIMITMEQRLKLVKALSSLEETIQKGKGIETNWEAVVKEGEELLLDVQNLGDAETQSRVQSIISQSQGFLEIIRAELEIPMQTRDELLEQLWGIQRQLERRISASYSKAGEAPNLN